MEQYHRGATASHQRKCQSIPSFGHGISVNVGEQPTSFAWDPNQLVAVTDTLSATMLPASESFTIVRKAAFGDVLRGVSFTPGTGVTLQHL